MTLRYLRVLARRSLRVGSFAFLKVRTLGFVSWRLPAQWCGAVYPLEGIHAYQPPGRLFAFGVRLW
jgi:hypothetical protein